MSPRPSAAACLIASVLPSCLPDPRSRSNHRCERSALNSLALLPLPVVGDAIGIDNVMLAMAMAGLGLTTHLSAVRTAGMRPLALAAALFGGLICGGIAIHAGVSALFF